MIEFSNEEDNPFSQKYNAILKNLRMCIYWISPEKRLLFISPTCSEITGYSAQEFYENPDKLFSIVFPEDRETIGTSACYSHEKNKTHYGIFRITTKKDEIRWIEHECQPFYDETGTFKGNIGINRDITYQKGKGNIANLQHIFNSAVNNIFDNLNLLIIISDAKRRIVWVNSIVKDFFNFEPAELLGKDINDLLKKHGAEIFENAKVVTKQLLSSYKKNTEINYLECHILPTKNRKERWLGYRGIPITSGLYAGGRLEYYADITDRKQIEDELRASEEKFRLLVETSPDTISLMRLKDGKLVFLNDSFSTLTGYSPEEVLGKSTSEFDIWANPEDREKFAQLISTKKKVRNLEVTFKTKNGIPKTCLISADIIHYKNDAFILSVTRDIEDLKTLEKEQELLLEQVNAALTRINFLLKAAPAVIFSAKVDYPYPITFISENLKSISGYPPGLFLEKKKLWIELIHPDDQEAVLNGLKHLSEKTTKTFEFRFKFANGQYHWIQLGANIVRSKRTKSLFGYWIDISERKNFETALQKSEKLLKEAQHIGKQGSWEYDLVNDKLYASEELYRLFELEEGSQVPSYTLFFNRIHPKDRRLVSKCYTKSLREKKPLKIEHRLLLPDGRVKWISTQGITYYDENGNPIRSVGSTIDITEKKLIEISLRESEERFRFIFEHTGTATLLVDKKGNIKFANQMCRKLFGYSTEQLKNTPWHQLASPETVKKGRVYFNKSFEAPKEPRQFEGNILDSNGNTHTCLISISVMPDNKNAIISIWDITQRIKAEEDRRLLYSVIEHTNEAISIADANYNFLYVNKFFTKLYGYSFDEVINKPVTLIQSPKQDPAIIKKLEATINSGKAWKGYLYKRKKDGTDIEVQVTVAPILDNRGIPTNFIAIHHDVTREREIEQRAKRSQRLEALGTLAGGIAHDFNNILTPILGYTYLSMELANSNDKLYNNLKQIELAAERARELVHQILTFSRQIVKKRNPILISPIIKEALKLLRAGIPSTITIEQQIEPIEDTVIADPTEIHQIIVNLCTNAYQAMPKGGKLTVRLEKVKIDESFIENFPEFKKGAYLKLTVQDTGVGIPDKIMDRIFEPYFTTKTKEDGTGLGLATVHGIVTSMGGYILVDSQKNKGTTFTIYFPIVNRSVTTTENNENGIATGNETIVFVDDEPTLINLGTRILQKFGYRVHGFTNPNTALDFIKKNPQSFDLLITDMTMPSLTGLDLINEVKKIRKEIPVILISGYSDEINPENASQKGVDRFLYKPYSPKQFPKIIRELLDSKKNK